MEGDGFRREMLDPAVISLPLQGRLRDGTDLHDVLIDLHFAYRGGPDAAQARVRELIETAIRDVGSDAPQGVDDAKTLPGGQYVVARLESRVIRAIIRLDREAGQGRAGEQAIHRIWPDFQVRPLLHSSAATIKATAAHAAFAALGDGIVWAVLDSGIAGDHPHFAKHRNLELPPPLEHQDLTGGGSPLTDEYGHGTHVAGIIAGALTGTPDRPIRAARRSRDEHGEIRYDPVNVETLTGVAPKCKLVSYKVLDENGSGLSSTIIAALQEIHRINDFGRDLKIHGVNLSVGYPFDPEWFACGQSPLCLEVNRLVKSGVMVVAAAGNTGYVWNQDHRGGAVAAGADLTINDPGNAEAAITVGSTHRDMPHTYGVSYFSSKGPTGDGRLKPDLVAPGERILSCAAGKLRAGDGAGAWEYLEDSGTSMAAPHVSGAIAAFLSIKREFIGQPEKVKEIFLSAAVDLGRVKEFQGHGLLDLMKAIQSC
ncbi:Peptidase S8 and S53 [Carbonactinospora thermoautotrophica]|uniref:Peptidase S8 and S53 n=2 Tax=Carbonactinospora thermoautotrophica TaxID=1469144 RepID=A0A132MKQ9_9ACTN|nr:S8 family peptidase [Carbonactinospora thermoautotrophica]KWW98444.1 Peptidase S8 and S53 [Carbonactinospora thermoautotrophica]